MLDIGAHTVSALVNNSNGDQSPQSSNQNFNITMSADLNSDGKVNLTDFSILMANYGLNPPPNTLADINDDSKVNLTDFSIMMFYWSR